MKGILIALSGPSGVGKGTIIARLKQDFPQFIYPVSSTTREKRPDESEGRVYNFISREEFETAIAEGKFFEWAIVHQKDYYGTPKQPIVEALEAGKIVVRELDMQGILSFQKALPKENLITIFIKPEKIDLLKARIERRGKLPEEEMQRRMHSAQMEMEQAKVCNYQVENRENHFEEAYEQIKQTILKEAEKAGLQI